MTGRAPETLDDPGQAGFDNSWGPQAGAVPNFYNWNQLINSTDPVTGAITVDQQMIQTYPTSEDVDRALGWLDDQEQNDDQPWFIWGGFVAPHLPARETGHYPPANLIPASRTDGVGDDDCNGPEGNTPRDASPQLIRNCYEAGMEAFDAEIGRLLDGLASRGELENTIVIFVGDNGTDQPAVIDPVEIDHSKGTLYQQGIAVPLIVSGPGIRRPGRTTANPTHTVDLYKTILDFAGASRAIPRNLELDSISLERLIRFGGISRRFTNFT